MFDWLGLQLLPPLKVSGRGIELRSPSIDHFEAWAFLREASRDFLTPWEPLWQANELTRPAFRVRLKRQARERAKGSAYSFFVFRQSDGALVGGLGLSHVRRGVAQTASLGYWIGAPFARQGYMSAAVRVALAYAFETLQLHRIEAACLPRNAASIRLLERTGFQREGLARSYLRIAGQWEDHFLYAALAEDTAQRLSAE